MYWHVIQITKSWNNVVKCDSIKINACSENKKNRMEKTESIRSNRDEAEFLQPLISVERKKEREI